MISDLNIPTLEAPLQKTQDKSVKTKYLTVIKEKIDITSKEKLIPDPIIQNHKKHIGKNYLLKNIENLSKYKNPLLFLAF